MPDPFNATSAVITMMDPALESRRRINTVVHAMSDQVMSLIVSEYLSPGRPVVVGVTGDGGICLSLGATVHACVPRAGESGYLLALELHA